MNFKLSKGQFVLSIDAELAWGSVYNGSFARRWGHYERTRDAIDGLLALLERYEIRATWAVVGHLFLDHCQPEAGHKHGEITRPQYQWFSGDWFEADPCGHTETDPFWYGPDIVRKIKECKVPQEIGSHGFSHMIIGDPGCSRECFDSEIRACVDVARKWDVDLKSFVFPRNRVGHLDVLASHGFSSYRGEAPDWYSGLPGPFRKLGRAVDSVMPIPPPVTTPKVDVLWDIPASYFYPHRDGLNRLIPTSLSVYKSKLGLERAAKQRGIFHLWFHPFNLASDVEGLLKGLESVFERVSALREAGRLDNSTMGDLAELFEAQQREVNVQ